MADQVMDICKPREICLLEGTVHTVISDVEEGSNWPQEVTWITCCEKTESQLLDVIQAIVERDDPQRVSVPGIQQFVGVLPVDKVCHLVDNVMKSFVGTKHQVVIPTVRFIPASFMYWEHVFAVNKFIWSQAVAYGFGVLNLHRNFMARQSRSWVVHGPCYAEFSADQGLGAMMSCEGVKRYEARLLRLHTSGFDVEHTPSVPVGDVMPLPLWSTAGFCQNRGCCELLESLGYVMEVPKPKKLKGQAKGEAPGAVQAVSGKEKAVNVSRGAKRGRSVSVGQEQEAGPVKAGKGRGRGRGRVQRDSSGNQISTIQMEAGTVRSMIRQISDLKGTVRDREADLQRIRKERDALVKELERAQEDVRRKDNVVAVYEARSRAESRSLRREREAQWEESQEWQRQRQEWRQERKDMLQMYEELHGKHHLLKGQFQVFQELGNSGEQKERKVRKEKRAL